MAAPIPAKRPSSRELFGETLVDEYAWLRQRDDPAVRAHLEAETAHAEAHLDARLRADLYAEMRGRIKEDDRSVPSKDGPWLYYSRTEEGDEYPRHCRRPVGTDEAHEQVYLDENELAEGLEYFDLASLEISPDHRLCAFTVDLDGSEIYTIRVLDLDTGELLPDELRGCAPSLAWAGSEAAPVLVYSRLDEAHRPWQAWRHQLGREQADDALVHQEDDESFYLSLYRTRSDAYVILSADSQVTSEVYLIPTSDPEAAPRSVAPRRQDVEYGVEHHGEHLLILTNEGARNFKLMCAPLPPLGPGREALPVRTLLDHREDVLVEGLDAFAGHLVVWERCQGLRRIRVVPLDPFPERLTTDDDQLEATGEHLVEFPDPSYAIWPGSNPEFETATLRFGYTSLTTPNSTYDYHLVARTRTLRKRQEIVGGHDPADYRSARLWATSGDGERVPISLVWKGRAGAEPPRGAPLVLSGYGAYGACSDPHFSSTRLSLLQRGAVWAIAHVRGGSELGRRWYEAGKLAHKHNTFGDFIACAEHLVAEGWTRPDRLAATGGSAGGLLIGAVANARPELFAALVADVPFVDVLNTMLDPTLPLTMVEREEWGDPTTEQGFAWIRAYSPYENVGERAYPPMLVIAGFNDPRVGYWEAAKWVARLRERKTDPNEILLWVNMGAGHGGASGRFEFLHELALEYAFLIQKLRLVNQ